MSKQTQRQHYLHQLSIGIQKRKTYGKNRPKLSRFRKRNTS